MTVGLDATYSVGDELSGIGVYCSRLIDSLLAAAPQDRFLLCYRPNRFFRALLAPRPAANASRRLLEDALRLPPSRVDLFHGLNQRLPRHPFPVAVATFHDLFVLTGEFSTPEFRRRFSDLARDAASRSDHVIAVSHYTAQRVQEMLAVEPSRITVVHHGVDPIPEFPAGDLAAFRQRYRLDRPFLLHVGAMQTRKNGIRLVEAFERLSHDVDLVFAGSDGYGAAEIHARIAASPARSRIRILGYVSRGVLDRLYRSASALAFPSLEEGFGIPVLEAMAARLPVVTSDRSALAEVAGDAAILADPADGDAIAAALDRVLADSAARAELIRKGCRRAAQFSWTRAASETLQVYRRLTGTAV